MTTFLWCLAFFLVTASVLLFLARGGWPRDEQAAPPAPPVRDEAGVAPVAPDQNDVPNVIVPARWSRPAARQAAAGR